MLASADSNIGELSQISQDLNERGLTPAHVTIEYSLTDDCGLTGLHVIDNSNPAALDSEVVEKLVKVMIGPFSGVTHPDELIKFATDSESPPLNMSMTSRTISWNTDDGHRYVQCRFYMNGELESARHIDGHGNQYKEKIQDRIIDQRLSELGVNTMRASFVSEDD